MTIKNITKIQVFIESKIGQNLLYALDIPFLYPLLKSNCGNLLAQDELTEHYDGGSEVKTAKF